MREKNPNLTRILRAASAPENLPYTILGILAAVSVASRIVLILR